MSSTVHDSNVRSVLAINVWFRSTSGGLNIADVEVIDYNVAAEANRVEIVTIFVLSGILGVTLIVDGKAVSNEIAGSS